MISFSQSAVEDAGQARTNGCDVKGFELRSCMGDLLVKFDQWVLSKKNRVISERDTYTKILADQAELVETLKKTHQQLLEAKAALAATLEKEQKECTEKEADLRGLADQRAKLESLKAELEKKGAESRNKLKKEQEIHEQKERMRLSTLEKEQPELAFFKQIFALEIEALRKDLMKFVFSNVDSDDWSREFTIIIDVSLSSYRVTCCDPMLQDLETMVEGLNRDRDFYLFLKKVRQAFVTLVKEEQLSRTYEK